VRGVRRRLQSEARSLHVRAQARCARRRRAASGAFSLRCVVYSRRCRFVCRLACRPVGRRRSRDERIQNNNRRNHIESRTTVRPRHIQPARHRSFPCPAQNERRHPRTVATAPPARSTPCRQHCIVEHPPERTANGCHSSRSRTTTSPRRLCRNAVGVVATINVAPTTHATHAHECRQRHVWFYSSAARINTACSPLPQRIAAVYAKRDTDDSGKTMVRLRHASIFRPPAHRTPVVSANISIYAPRERTLSRTARQRATSTIHHAATSVTSPPRARKTRPRWRAHAVYENVRRRRYASRQPADWQDLCRPPTAHGATQPRAVSEEFTRLTAMSAVSYVLLLFAASIFHHSAAAQCKQTRRFLYEWRCFNGSASRRRAPAASYTMPILER